MAAGDDNLRAILDHRGAPPKDRQERRYYESMMRRLGYSEAELAPPREVEAAPVAPTAPVALQESHVVEETGGSRLIELEYGGAEHIPEFEPVRAKVHPTQVEPTEFDVHETHADIEDEENEFILVVPDDEEDEDEILEFSEVDDDGLVEFTEAGDEDWDDWEDPALENEPAPVATPEPEVPSVPAGSKHGEFTLYRRELDGGQHVYFYSRKEPSDAEPAQVPEGYTVKESEESGLPFLARAN